MADQRLEYFWRATAPTDPNDPARFAESRESVVDLLSSWLRSYFDRQNAPTGHLAEAPGLRKFITYAQTNGQGGPLPPTAPGLPQPRNTGGGGGGALPAVGGSQLPTRAVTIASWGEVCEDYPRIVIGVPRLADNPAFAQHIIASGPPRPTLNATTAGPYIAAAGATLTVLVYRNAERRADSDPIEVTITLETEDALDYNAITATEFSAVINRSGAPYLCAAPLADGTLQLSLASGRAGDGGIGPAWFEVSGGSLATIFGWGRSGDLVSIAASGDDWLVTLAAGSALTAADIGRYLTLEGTTRVARNDGRWLITATPTATTCVVEIPYGIADPAPTDATWWIGSRASNLDSTRSVRRLKCSKADIELRVMTEDFNTMQTLGDGIQALASFFSDRDSGSVISRGLLTQLGNNGSGITQPAAPSQSMSLHIIPPIAIGNDIKTPRPGDAEAGIYECTITFAVFVQEALDRTLTTTPTEYTIEVTDATD